MKLNLSNNKNENKNVQNAQVINAAIKREQSGVGSSYAEREQGRDESLNQTIAEPIEDAVIVEEKAPLPAPPKGRAKKAPKKGAPKTNTSAVSPQTSPSYTLVTYTTKKGGTACYLAGFKTEADAKAMADQLPHSISNSYRYNDNGEKVYVISFGTRYVDAATALCHALNNGDQKDIHKYIADCHEIYNAVVSSAKAEREKKTQERKAERAKEKADELAKVKKANGLYSMDEIAAMMKRAMAGEDVPELKAVKEAMGLAA